MYIVSSGNMIIRENIFMYLPEKYYNRKWSEIT